MKQMLFFFLLFFIVSCSSTGNLYKYKYALEKTGTMVYEDSIIKTMFLIDRNSIQLTMINKSNIPVKLVWDDASIVINGKSFRAANENIRVIDSEKSQVSRILPPNSEINEKLIPTTNIKSIQTGTTILDLFPVNDFNQKFMREQITLNKGKKLRLFLPLLISNEVVYYDFVFVITNVGPAKFFKD